MVKDNIEIAVGRMSKKDKEEFEKLHDNYEEALPEEFKEMLEKFKTLWGKKVPLEIGGVELDYNWRIYTSNAYTCDHSLRIKMSRFNHSCRPNAVVSILFRFIKVHLISELLLTQKLVWSRLFQKVTEIWRNLPVDFEFDEISQLIWILLIFVNTNQLGDFVKKIAAFLENLDFRNFFTYSNLSKMISFKRYCLRKF